MKILAHVLAMADDEVLGMISPRTIRDIKREDPTPMFKVYCVGQEGEARPKIVGVGSTVQRWYQSAIEKLTARLGLGLPAYHNHAASNAEPNRQPIGEIVGKALKSINGFLSSVAVAYIFPQFRDLPLDVASIEADVMVPPDARDFDVKDVDISAVTGVALGNSAMNTPAFPRATLLAQLQAFAGNQNQSDKGSGQMTLEEIRKAIQEAHVVPSQLFEAEDLTNDPVIRAHVKQEVAGEWNHRKRTDDAFDKARKEWDDKEKTYLEQIASNSKVALKVKARETFETILSERPKLKEDARLVKYINKAFDKSFDPKDAAKVKDELNKFVDDQVAEYADLMGDAKGTGDQGKGDAGKAGVTTRSSADANRDKTNLLDPKNNELIPAD